MRDPDTSMHLDTALITLGRPDPTPAGPLSTPLIAASALHPGGNSTYVRDGHQQFEALEQALGYLEGGRALTFSSGMAAASAAISLIPQDAIVVAPEVAYMDVRTALTERSDNTPTQLRLVDITDTQAVIAACEDATVLWLESPTNPLLGIADLPTLCAHAKANGMLSIVDSTFATPLLQKPLALGADIVIHSATKAIGGHGDLMLGAAIARTDLHHDQLHSARTVHGAIPGSLETMLCLRGLRTLALRLDRSQQNAASLAERLSAHPEIDEVRYPGLPSHPQHELAKATLNGFGFMLTFRVTGGAQRADAMLDELKILTHATSLGSVETTLERRAKYPAEQALVPEDLLRVSVGCEHPDDLFEDLDQALNRTAS